MSRNLGLETIDFVENIRDADCEIPQNCRYLMVRQPGRSFIERYKNGEQCVALRRAEPFSGSESKQDGLVFQAFNNFGTANNHVAGPNHQIPVDLRLGDYQPLMLTQNVQTVKGPQHRIPSLVWLECFDRSALPRGKPLYAFDACQRIDEVEQASKDWKMRVGIRIFAVPDGKRCRDKIEAAAQGIDDCADPSVESEWERLVIHYRCVASAVRVWLLDDRIGISALPFDEPLLEQWDLGFGPYKGSLSI